MHASRHVVHVFACFFCVLVGSITFAKASHVIQNSVLGLLAKLAAADVVLLAVVTLLAETERREPIMFTRTYC